MTFETLLVGLVLAVLYVEVMEIYPGGIIVPGYVALYLDQPGRVLATLLVAAAALLSYRILSRHLILFGKRRFVTFVLLGAVWAQTAALVLPRLPPESADVRAIGWLIPGLLANQLEKQRVVPTLAALFTVAIMTYFLVRAIHWL